MDCSGQKAKVLMSCYPTEVMYEETPVPACSEDDGGPRAAVTKTKVQRSISRNDPVENNRGHGEPFMIVRLIG